MPRRSPHLIVVGNPLLDLIVLNGAPLVKKYSLKANDSVFATPERVSIYDDILQHHNPVLIPGGDINIARAAAYILPPNDVVFIGSIGDDTRGQKLARANQAEGVLSAFHVERGADTGSCAVLVQDSSRSLVANLCAAHRYKVSHLYNPGIQRLLASPQHIYISGYFLSHGMQSALQLVSTALERQQYITVNLAAPQICTKYRDNLNHIMTCADFVIGNVEEVQAWAAANGLTSKSISAIALHLFRMGKLGVQRPRYVIITNGSEPTTVVSESLSPPSSPVCITEHPVDPIPARDVVDTTGAGDSFAGGFLAALIMRKEVDEAIEIGHRLGSMCVGARLKFPKENVL
ncbi:Ribokinase-like protein [Clavulina sp. PMI_390]|nr:Ribokinase-like protein [Clavulina sp. PMI_390]